MANCVHSTSIILPHVTALLSTRLRPRVLFTAVITVVLGGGITAITAASIADLVPTLPDTDLIQLCGEFVALEKAACAIYDGLKPIADKARAV